MFSPVFKLHLLLYLTHYVCLIRNLADIDGDGRLTRDEFCVAMYYVDVAKSGKPVPSTLPPEVIPPACRKPAPSAAQPAPNAAQPAPNVAQPAPHVAQPAPNPAPVAEKPVSLPRPTSKPPSDATRVPAIQPPTVAAARRLPTASAAPPPAAAAPTKPAAVDPFGMDPLAFDAVAPLLDAPLVPVVSAVSPTQAVAKEVSSQVKEQAVAVSSPENVSTVSAAAANAEPRVLSPPTATTTGNDLMLVFVQHSVVLVSHSVDAEHRTAIIQVFLHDRRIPRTEL